jgi:hypothetical protein
MVLNIFKSRSEGFLFVAALLVSLCLQGYIYVNHVFRRMLTRCSESGSGGNCINNDFFLGFIAIVALSLLLSFSVLAFRRGRTVISIIPIAMALAFWGWVLLLML